MTSEQSPAQGAFESPPGLVPVRKHSVSQSVFDQLLDGIVSGRLAPGEPLPPERVLCTVLGVNRSAVREALKRLEQAGLVDVRHGGGSHVLDYRTSGGLDLLPHLMITADGRFDPEIIRSVLEMRSAIAPDVARLAVERAGRSVADRLARIVAEMEDAGGDLARLQDLAADLWAELIEASGNVAYRLAYNSLRETYDRCRELLTGALAEELTSLQGYRSLVDAARTGNAAVAEEQARALVRLGECGVAGALDALAAAGTGDAVPGRQ